MNGREATHLNAATGDPAGTYCLFQEPWWLDAVAPGAWSAAQVEEQGRVIARLPYVIRRRWGLVAVTQPPLTPTLGPWVDPTVTRLSRQTQLMQELIAQLPRFDLFRQGFCPEVTNWLPFYWRGFEQSTRYTYRLNDLSNSEQLLQRFDSNIRQTIRKAERRVAVRDDLGMEKLLELVQSTYARKRERLPFSPDLLRRIDAAGNARAACRYLFAESADGRVHAALMMVWDHRCAYYLTGGIDPESARSGAMTLLLWHAIRLAGSLSRQFDFEGSMHEPIERFFRKFAPVQTPYSFVKKLRGRLWPLARLRRIF